MSSWTLDPMVICHLAASASHTSTRTELRPARTEVSAPLTLTVQAVAALVTENFTRTGARGTCVAGSIVMVRWKCASIGSDTRMFSTKWGGRLCGCSLELFSTGSGSTVVAVLSPLNTPVATLSVPTSTVKYGAGSGNDASIALTAWYTSSAVTLIQDHLLVTSGRL